MSLESKNFYELLGVERDAPAQVIRDAYKELARIYHPDSHYFDDILASAGVSAGDASIPQSPEESETFKLITEAYNTLNNVQKRQEYDRSLPRETLDWSADIKNEFEADQRERQFQNPSVSQPHSWGSFGKIEDRDERAPQPPEQMAYRAVSEIIRENRSLAARLKRLFRGY